MKSARIFFQKGNYLTYYSTTVEPFTKRGHLSTTATFFGGQSIHWLLFKLLYKGRFLLSPRWPLWKGSTVHMEGDRTLNPPPSQTVEGIETTQRRCLGNYLQTCLFCDPSMTNFSTIFASCLYRRTIGVRLSLWRKANGRSKAISAVYLQVIINYRIRFSKISLFDSGGQIRYFSTGNVTGR